MRLFLHGITAARWWARAHAADALPARAGSDALRECAPSTEALDYLAETAPRLSPPYHLLVSSADERRSIRRVVVHRSSYPFPQGSFVRVADGIYAPCPALCFVQLAESLPLLRVVKEGYALCGSFALSDRSSTGLAERDPLATAAGIGRFIERNRGLRGSTRAAAALAWVKDGSASPRETDLAMRLTLPMRLGGFGLAGAVLNRRIDPGRQARPLMDGGYYVGDVCWPSAKLVVEYDSNLHLTPRQLARDAQKRRALEADGYLVLTVTSLQLDDPVEMGRIARLAARRLGKRLRIQTADFEKRQSELFGLSAPENRLQA